MSRRRESYEVASPVTTDDLYRAMYGEQQRQTHRPVAGCAERCCASLVVDGPAIWHGIWRGLLWALAPEGVLLVAVVALILTVWRATGWRTP